MNRLAYIPYRLAFDLVSLFSRMLNAIVFGGSTAPDAIGAGLHRRARQRVLAARGAGHKPDILLAGKPHRRRLGLGG